jgi:hypothetical protein
MAAFWMPLGHSRLQDRTQWHLPGNRTSFSCCRAVKDIWLTGGGKTWHEANHENYRSFRAESGNHAQVELDRIAAKGYIDLFDFREEVISKWPDAQANRVALLLEERDEGSWKRRFIIDLLRSGFNGDTLIPERVVLPRISDFICSVIDLLGYCSDEDSQYAADMVEMVTMVFSDAFYTLWLKEASLGKLAFKTLQGWAVFSRLCFGMSGAPLIWGRVAASACRLAQAIYMPSELRIQCYIDEPAIVVRGSPQLRKHLLAMLFLFWAMLGLALSFGKGSRGKTVPWIGATLTIETRKHPSGLQWPGVTAQLQRAKFLELVAKVDALHTNKGMVPICKVRTVAGQLSWASGIFPWVKCFNAVLWRAMTAHLEEATSKTNKMSRRRKRPTDLFFTLRIAQALAWVRMLLHGLIKDTRGKRILLQKWYSLAHRTSGTAYTIRADASVHGFGAIRFAGAQLIGLVFGHVDQRRLQENKSRAWEPCLAGRMGAAGDTSFPGLVVANPQRRISRLSPIRCHCGRLAAKLVARLR